MLASPKRHQPRGRRHEDLTPCARMFEARLKVSGLYCNADDKEEIVVARETLRLR